MNEFGVITAADTVRIERLLPGPIERVWQYLVDPEKRGRWLASGEAARSAGVSMEMIFRNSQLSRSDDRAPDKYAHIADEARMTAGVLACEPPDRLVLSWGSPSGEESEVRFDLSQVGDKVLLIVTHTRLAERGEMVSVAAGWHAHLEILLALLSGDTPPSFWSTHTHLEAEYESRIPE